LGVAGPRSDDRFARRAREEGYLSRAVYKLDDICEEFGLIDPGDTVVDLGASPGGWTQIALERVGEDGRVVAVDRQPIEVEDERVTQVRGDVTEEDTVDEIREAAGGPVDVVLSDMSPNLSGNYSMDHARSVHLAQNAVEVAGEILDLGGSVVIKVFQGDLFKDFYDEVGDRFAFHKGRKPEASRDESSETYVIGDRFRG
jgi:23S rRNA (uridine2552-2'-O)-methyltransferase